MTTLPNKHYSGHRKTTGEGDLFKEHVEKRSGERNMDSRLQVQLEADGGGNTRGQCPSITSLD